MQKNKEKKNVGMRCIYLPDRLFRLPFVFFEIIYLQCSATCGVGYKKRTVFCRTSEGKVVNDVYCRDRQKPSDGEKIVKCDERPCPVKYPQSNIINNNNNNNNVGRDFNNFTHGTRHKRLRVQWRVTEWKPVSV